MNRNALGALLALVGLAAVICIVTLAGGQAQAEPPRQVRFDAVGDVPEDGEPHDRAARAAARIELARMAREAAEAREADAPACEEPQCEPACEEPAEIVAEPAWGDGGAQSSSEAPDLRTQGVVYDGGTRYTWYSQRTLPGGGLTELNANGRAVDGDGFVVDADGYIAVASSDHAKGTVLDTPFGAAKVYDTGCQSGTVDVYTDF